MSHRYKANQFNCSVTIDLVSLWRQIVTAIAISSKLNLWPFARVKKRKTVFPYLLHSGQLVVVDATVTATGGAGGH